MILGGVVLLSLMTWFFPGLAWAWTFFATSKKNVNSPAKNPLRRIAVLIPAHNEEVTLRETLPSILQAAKHLNDVYPRIQVDILVGADNCSDRTVQTAEAFGVTVVNSPTQRGKWKTLRELIELAAEADWILLADAGILWTQELLIDCLPLCEKADVLGVAPTYRNPAAGIVEGIFWKMESTLKTLENKAGGPMTVHGPTVLYRRRELAEAFETLSNLEMAWINDDVAISLYLRLKHPKMRLVYVPDIATHDSRASQLDLKTGQLARQFGRRRRMVFGNLQWIKRILIPRWKKNPVASLIAMRRVFRLFWAPCLMIFALGLGATFGFANFLIFVASGLLFLILLVGMRAVFNLAEAATASLLAPYYLLSGRSLSKWK